MSKETELLAFFENFLLERGIECAQNDLPAFNFVQSGQLDSFEILSMVVQLETTFDISIPPDAVVDPLNSTVEGLMKYVNTVISS